MLLSVGFILSRLFLSTVVVGMGSNRRCGGLTAFMLSMVASPLLAFVLVKAFSDFKNKPGQSVFLRDRDGNLVPALDDKGKQRYDKVTNQPLYLKQVKDGVYYREREREFLRTMFVSLPLLPFTVVPKLVRGIRRSARRSAAHATDTRGKEEPGRLLKVDEAVYCKYDQMLKVQEDGEAKAEEQSVGNVRRFRAYALPDGTFCIVCRKAEMAELVQLLAGTPYEGCTLVSTIEEKDFLKENTIRGERRGLVFLPDLVPQPFELVLTGEGRFIDSLEYRGLDRGGFDELLHRADDIVDSLSEHSQLFGKGREIQSEDVLSIRTGVNSIELTLSGKVIAAIRFDAERGRIVTDIGVPEKLASELAVDHGPDLAGLSASDPAEVLSAYGRLVLSEKNIDRLRRSEELSLRMEETLHPELARTRSVKI